jgi:hypothetical protein
MTALSLTEKPMRTPQMNERGVALVIAIFALVVIGALVAGTFLVGRLEQRMGGSTVYAAQASEAADAGLADAMDIDQAVYTGMAAWTPAAPVADLVMPTEEVIPGRPGLRYTQTLRRLNESLFLVRSVGERVAANGAVLGSAEHGVLMRIERAIISVNSAITVMQPIKLNGNAFTVDGENSNPPHWEDPATGWNPCPLVDPGHADDKVGIRSATSTGVDPKDTTTNNDTPPKVTGYPTAAVANDTSVTSSTFRDFVDKTFASMTKQPGVKVLNLDTPYNDVAPVVTNGVCDKTAPYNFGEPTHPSASSATACYNYFPVVNGTGSQTKFAAGSRGQGTLLIEGDMEINGNFEWTGLIIVRGSIKINGTGNKITGAVLAESVTDNNTIGGDVHIKYSACAIDKAVKGSATPAPLEQRGWMQLY